MRTAGQHRRPQTATATAAGWKHRLQGFRFPWPALLSPAAFTWAGDCALAGILFIAPVIMGGRHPLGRLVYIALVGLLAACWLVEQTGRAKRTYLVTGVEWLLVLGAGLGLLQVAPLPASWLAWISSYQGQLLPEPTEVLLRTTGLGAWTQISFTPVATWQGWGIFVAHAVLFLVLVQRLQNEQQIETLLRWLAYGTLGMATLGLLQYASGTPKFAWLFEHPSRLAHLEVMGPFANSNHFAHFLALGIGPLIWWLKHFSRTVTVGPTGNTFRGQQTNTSLALVISVTALATVCLAGMLSKSRGGIVTMFLAASIVTIVYLRAKILSHRCWYLLGGVLVVVLAGLTVHGYDAVQDELGTLAAGQLDREDARAKIWRANLDSFRRFPLLGTGIGSHAEIYPRFFPHASLVQFSHAESTYIQLLTETGLVGLGLVVVGMGYVFHWAARALRCRSAASRGHAGACLAGLVASAAHAAVDFPWYLTSCMSLAIVLAALACSLARRQGGAERSVPAPLLNLQGTAWFGPVAIGVLGLVILAASLHVGPAAAAGAWNRYLKLSLQAKKQANHALLGRPAEDPTDARLESSVYDSNRRMASYLEKVLARDPLHFRAHSRMAAVCLHMFEYAQHHSQNAMGLAHIRDTAQQSRFASRAELDAWLEKAVGDPRLWLDKALYHAGQALRLCPLQAEAYLFAAELAFLRGVPDAEARQLVADAARVRPHDPFVLYTLGRECFLQGNVEPALICWRRSFHLSREYREEIIRNLGRHLSVPLFITNFEPDIDALESMLRFYRQHEMPTEAQIVASLVVSQLEQQIETRAGVPAARLLQRCCGIHRFLGNEDQALDCARRALDAAPNWFPGRLGLADEYLRQKKYQEALQEYRWCKARKPLDKPLRQRIRAAEDLLARSQAQLPDRADAPSMLPAGGVFPSLLVREPPMDRYPTEAVSHIR